MSVKQRRAAILDADDRAERIITEPKWGGDLLLIEPDVETRLELADAIMASDEHESRKHVYPLMIVLCAHDPETRERLFTHADIDALQRKNGAIVERVGKECVKMASLSVEAVEVGKDDSSSGPEDSVDTSSDSLSDSG